MNKDIYCEIKNFFKSSLCNQQLCEMTFKENNDNLALYFSIKNKTTKVDYYYCFGDFAIHRFINDANEVLISKNPENFIKIISRNIQEIINNAEVI